MKKIAIFASGSGTNAENIIKHFCNHNTISTTIVFCNKPGAGVIERAKKLNIPVKLFSREDFYSSDKIIVELENLNIDYIILAGFLWLLPEMVIKKFPNRIINIHPALLPKYGGKGMYGMNVHKAVIKNGERESGITIHQVNENYDEGETIFQATCEITPDDTPDSLAEKIHDLEYRHFPTIIENYILM